mmetsp:Transcript_35837/g.55133  ORF Transcript_35837/g.55133 Transcript_35837/m.55133 type:complete len:91 (-) Transcript_35837:1035-1307(-)
MGKLGITMLDSQDNQGNTIMLFNKDEIENAIMKANQNKFKKAQQTPFLQRPLLGLVGNSGTGKYAEEILRGSANTNGMQDSAKTLIPAIA